MKNFKYLNQFCKLTVSSLFKQNKKYSELFKDLFEIIPWETKHVFGNSERLAWHFYFNDEVVNVLPFTKSNSFCFTMTDGEGGHKFLKTAITNNIVVKTDITWKMKTTPYKFTTETYTMGQLFDHKNKTYQPHWISEKILSIGTIVYPGYEFAKMTNSIPENYKPVDWKTNTFVI